MNPKKNAVRLLIKNIFFAQSRARDCLMWRKECVHCDETDEKKNHRDLVFEKLYFQGVDKVKLNAQKIGS